VFEKGKGFIKEKKTYYSANIPQKKSIHQVMELTKMTKDGE